jgi:NitT/TauT family transport system permease protein
MGPMTYEGRIRLGVIVGFIALIETLCRLKIIPATVMIAPSEMAGALAAILASGEFNGDILSSTGNIAAAAAISVVLGFVAGFVIHAGPGLRGAVEPLLASYYAIPAFMFYPVFIIVFGVGNRAIIAIAVLLAVVAMITATLNGLDRIPQVLRKTARMYRMSRPKRALLIDLPAAAPYLFTGVKLSVAYAFIGVIASEFILSGSGLGYAIAYAYNNFQNREMYALMLLILVMATVVNGALDAVDKRLQARRRR